MFSKFHVSLPVKAESVDKDYVFDPYPVGQLDPGSSALQVI